MAAVSPSLSPAPSHRQFYQVTAQTPDLMQKVKKIFETVLIPLYGSQDTALDKIRLSKDRVCYLLMDGQEPLGVIVFKTEISDEYAPYGIQKSIEIKSLFVVNSGSNSGKGVGYSLFQKVIEEVGKLKLGQAGFHVTVSETKRESLYFFLGRGFKIQHVWRGKYQKEVGECLLSLSNQVDAASQEAISFPATEEKALSFNGFSSQLRVQVRNAHWDDITALRLLANGTFVSGSKDNRLCLWDWEGKQVKVAQDVEPMGIASEDDWITTVGVLNGAYWLSGERNGRVNLWTTSGKYVREILLKRPKSEHFSLAKNRQRVNCLVAGLDPQKLSFFVGFPTMFDEFNVIEGRTTSSTIAHKNDWVYCIHPLTETRILAVVAATLSLWSKEADKWKQEQVLVPEPPKAPNTRHHITALLPLRGEPSQVAVSRFNGLLEIADLSKGKVVHGWQGHKDHIWSMEQVDTHLLASSGDDCSIRLWDIRTAKSVGSIVEKHPVGISALLSLNANTLVAGTRIPERKGTGANLLFYDLRTGRV